MLEILVHAEIHVADIPVGFRYLEIEAPDSISIDTVDVEALPGNSRAKPEATRQREMNGCTPTSTALIRDFSNRLFPGWGREASKRHAASRQEGSTDPCRAGPLLS